MKRTFLILITVVLLSGLITANCAPSSGEIFELTFATMNNPHGWNERAQSAFLNWLEYESKGRLKITYHYADLAPAGQEYAAVKSGLADMGTQYSLFMTDQVPANEVTTLPWLGNYPGAMQTTLAHMELYKEFPALQDEVKDVKLLWIDHANLTEIQTVRKPIRTMEDLKGLKQIKSILRSLQKP